MKRPNLYVWTSDHSGLELAKRFRDEGHGGGLVLIHPTRKNGKLEAPKTPEEVKQNAEKVKYLNKNGNGIVKKMWADEAMKQITRRDFCIFDQIYGPQFGDALFKRNIPVLGGSKVGFTMEKERQKTLSLFKKWGYDIPPQHSFGPGSSQKAIQFLKSSKDKTLFVFKSDNPSCLTCVAYESNDEIIQKLEAEKVIVDSDGFILQEKKDGIEFAVETWYYNGKPILAVVDIETKKKYNEMSEVQTGCASGITWNIPVNHPLRKQLNGPFDNFAKTHIGTGLMDVSVIHDPHEKKNWVLEPCGSRFAYNEFPAMMRKCSLPWGEFFIKYLRGEFKEDIGEKIFGTEIAASLRLFNDGNAPDQRIAIPDEFRQNYYLWDCHVKSGDLMSTGGEFGDSLGIIMDVGENPEAAMAKVRQNYFKIYMPTKFARDDFDEDDSPYLPLSRYHAMRSLKLI